MKTPRFVLVLLLVLTALPAAAAVPTPREFLGYELGQRFTSPERVHAYFQALAAASPLVTIEPYGETYEGRMLLTAVFTSTANRARIAEIRAASDAISRPDRTSRAAAERLASDTPAVVWFGFGVHGSESSSPEAAIMLGHWLATNAGAAPLLENLVIVIDPALNPDGRSRYVQWFHQARGAAAQSDRQAIEHYEPWPYGRFNHYLFDLNRDWAWATQRETRARIAAYQRWHPQVAVDFHEMSYESSYFFPPDAHPINQNIGGDIERWLETFGRANADAFEGQGWPYFVGETFDLFYPAYGDSWPSLRGAIGMTYEVAGGGAAGTTIRRQDDTVLTLHDRLLRHFTTAVTTLRTASEHRRNLLLRTWDALRRPIDAPATTWFLLDSPQLHDAVALLQRQGIQVAKLSATQRLRVTPLDGPAVTREIPAGSAVVTTAQPLGGLVTALMEKNPLLQRNFVEEQRERLEADEDDQFFDVTAWAIPIAMNIESYSTTAPFTAATTAWSEEPAPSPARGTYGYAVSGHDPSVYRMAGRLLANGIRFSVSSVDLTHEQRRLPRGTLIIARAGNGENFDSRMVEAANDAGAALIGIERAWSGPIPLGSSHVRAVRDPKIALLAGDMVSPPSLGALWHALDIDHQIPHVRIRADLLGSLDLSRYRVLVMPDGNYRLGKNETDKLTAWVRGGGVLVAVKDAGAFLRSKDVALSGLSTTTEKNGDKDSEDDKDDEEEKRHREIRVPGSAFRTETDFRSYLTFGMTRSPAAFVEGTTALALAEHRVDNIIRIAAKDTLLAGFAWPQSTERLAGSAWLVHEKVGSGSVITFADEPALRLFWTGTLPPFLNAVLYGPTFGHD